MSLYMSYQTVMMEKIHSTNSGHVVDVDIGVKPSSDSTAEKDEMAGKTERMRMNIQNIRRNRKLEVQHRLVPFYK